MNEKYLPTTVEGRLARTVEEAGEVIAAFGKMARFGPFSRHPDGGPMNLELLRSELVDLQHSITDLMPSIDYLIDSYRRHEIAPANLVLAKFP